MRFSLAAICVATSAILCVSSAQAQDDASLPARMAARRDLEQAKCDLRYYWQVEYPRKCRELDNAIDLTRSEVDIYNARLREYRPYSQFSTGNPFLFATQDVQMCLKQAECRLNDLLDERDALVRFHSDTYHALESQVYAARLRIVQLESQDDATTAPAAELPPPQH